MKINLHNHSNYSLDGEYEVNELIDILKKNEFDIVSITDHDTCEAYKHIGENQGIKVITGIEADAIVNNHTYDFLCYNFDLEEVYKYAKEKYQTVDKRQRKIFDVLVKQCEMNNIKLKDIESYDEKKEYAHAAIYRMLDSDFLNKYNITNFGDLYRMSSIDTEFPLYLDMHIVWPDIKELTDVIHKNNGKVFIAHPYRYKRSVEEVLSDVLEFVDGIEISNNPNSKEEVEFLYKHAKENGKLVSCGSDYHGNDKYSIECDYLTDEMINSVVSWIEK